MRFGHIFIDRPVLAAVISILVVLFGVIAYPTLPVAQYPEIVPPTVTVTATYPGASAEILADTVANPIEQQINGVENLLYISSQSTGDGRVQITCTFKLGTDLNVSQVLVQNRVANAQPRLPQQVQATGVIVRKSSPDLLLGVHFFSRDGSLSQQYVANFVTLNVRDQVLRTDGVGDVIVRGQARLRHAHLDRPRPGGRAQPDGGGDHLRAAGAQRADRGGQPERAAVRGRRPRLPAQRAGIGAADHARAVRRHHHQERRPGPRHPGEGRRPRRTRRAGTTPAAP